MVFNMDGHAFNFRIEARTHRYGPTFHDTIQFQAEIIMEAARPVFLYNERRSVW